MNQEISLALIALVSGGSLTALVNLLIGNKKHKMESREKAIDDRIAAWQKISEKNEARMELVESKLEICENTHKSLERYIILLEQTIINANPPLVLPEWPASKKENAITKENTGFLSMD